MQLKTSEFRSLFSDGLNGLAGEWVALGCDVCVPVSSEGNIVPNTLNVHPCNLNTLHCIGNCFKCDVDPHCHSIVWTHLLLLDLNYFMHYRYKLKANQIYVD